jgi:hypothetical protein
MVGEFVFSIDVADLGDVPPGRGVGEKPSILYTAF